MKKELLFICLVLPVLLASCDFFEEYYKDYKLEGMWQLKTIENELREVTYVDTVFYSFQREVVFSYMSVPDLALNPFYGYVDILPDNKIRIEIGKERWEHDHENFLNYSQWNDTTIIFDIKKYDNSNLVLFDEVLGKTYTFKKF